jgi:hypothetical protein
MKILTLLSILVSASSFACPFSMVEQDGRFLLVQKRLGDPPSPDDKIAKPLNRRGLQEITIKDKSGEIRKARVRVIFDSADKAEIQRVVEGRCSQY